MTPRIVLATGPVNFNKHHDGLPAVVEHELGLDPYSGVVVVFRCRGQHDQIKVLWWDGAGLALGDRPMHPSRFVIATADSPHTRG